MQRQMCIQWYVSSQSIAILIMLVLFQTSIVMLVVVSVVLYLAIAMLRMLLHKIIAHCTVVGCYDS